VWGVFAACTAFLFFFRSGARLSWGQGKQLFVLCKSCLHACSNIGIRGPITPKSCFESRPDHYACLHIACKCYKYFMAMQSKTAGWTVTCLEGTFFWRCLEMVLLHRPSCIPCKYCVFLSRTQLMFCYLVSTERQICFFLLCHACHVPIFTEGFNWPVLQDMLFLVFISQI